MGDLHMENRNSYFKPLIVNTDFYLQFFPAMEGGKALDVKEVMSYLTDLGYQNYDMRELNEAVKASEPTQVLIGKSEGNAFNEKIVLSISTDNMLVRCKFYPPAEGRKAITKEDVADALAHEKIVYGLDTNLINSLLHEREYCTEYLIGKGTPPTLGRDAKIEYYFSTSKSLKPKHNTDGSVNYHDLNIISRVEKNQLLAKLIPSVPGKPGKTILGEELKPKDVKNLKLSYANNIYMSDDGTELYSEVTGHASLVQGKVFVSAVYEVPADVDNSIGDINYPGNVLVKGNVKSGFVIHANGNIVVEGVVEGAQRGIHGMGKGLLSAEGNIVIKFIEGATVISGGYVETESIIQSMVSANTEVIVNGGKGLVRGGTVRVSSKVSARVIGSTMGIATNIEAGIEPKKLEHFNKIQQEAKNIAKKIEVVRPILVNYSEKLKQGITLPPDKVEYMKTQVMTMKTLQAQLAPITEEINRLRMEFISAGRAKVEVQDVIYPGVTIKISDVSVTTKSERKYCKFVKDGAEIKVMNL
jgi:hypothetical protein